MEDKQKGTQMFGLKQRNCKIEEWLKWYPPSKHNALNSVKKWRKAEKKLFEIKEM
jgi:hypothetical protein